MTNPSNMVRVRARNGGRASVYEANGWCQAYTSGLLEGEGVTQNTSADMNVLVGGSSTKPDVVLAENAAGYRVALDIVSQEAITITAPAANSRITAIVAYTDDLSLSSSEDTVTGSPASCGLIVVNGTTAASPVAPTDAQIRSAITTDGATGSQAAYCVIATIAVSSSTTAIDNDMITVNAAQVTSDKIDFTTFEPASIELPNATSGSFTVPSDGLLMIFGLFQCDAASTNCTAKVSFSGNSGASIAPTCIQYGAQYSRGTYWGFALCSEGDNVTWSLSTSNAGATSSAVSKVFLPCAI